VRTSIIASAQTPKLSGGFRRPLRGVKEDRAPVADRSFARKGEDLKQPAEIDKERHAAPLLRFLPREVILQVPEREAPKEERRKRKGEERDKGGEREVSEQGADKGA